MMTLDFALFGNGRGLSAPYWPQTFYWLPYRIEGDDTGKRRGAFYTFLGGYGAQLRSRQWRHPNAGEVRIIKGRRFRPLHSHRKGLRVEVAWSTKLPRVVTEANTELQQIRADLDNTMID